MSFSLLLTGGTGFFGRALLDTLLSTNVYHRIYIVSRDPDSFALKYPIYASSEVVKLIECDIQDSSFCLLNLKADHVIHGATDSTNGPNLSPLERFNQIVIGTRNTLDLAIKCGASRFLLVSSGGIYGPQPIDMPFIDEDCSLSPALNNTANTYSLSKRTAEHLCHLYQEKQYFDIVIARCFGFVGPYMPMRAHFAIGNLIYDALYSDCLTISGDGKPIRSFMYQSDLATWLIFLLQKGVAGEAYNVGSSDQISISELAHRIRDILSPNKMIRMLGQIDPITSRERLRYVPSISKALDLGLRLQVPLDDAIMLTGRNWA
jgi:UDP-glucuronate decarboxylase